MKIGSSSQFDEQHTTMMVDVLVDDVIDEDVNEDGRRRSTLSRSKLDDELTTGADDNIVIVDNQSASTTTLQMTTMIHR